MRSVYLREFRHVARMAFSMWNREPASPSAGSFDRRYWGWKSKDFGDATMQYAVRLAIAYATERGQTDTLPCLLEQYVRHVASLQRADGSFDQCYPFERTPGVIYDFLSTLVDVYAGPWLQGPSDLATLEKVIGRAATFVVNSDEVHGEIANHLAEYAFECLHHAKHFHDPKTQTKGEYYLDRMLREFDRVEGWFLEYDGADPGYQTRTLRYLVKCAALLDRTDLWEAAERAAEFLDIALMPDGSVHPMLGCRSTALLYPSGFEALAARSTQYEPLARRIRHAWSQGLAPLPSSLDFENAIRLADDALDAATLCPAGAIAEPMPSPATSEVIHRPRAGLLVFREPNRIVHVHHSLGGTVVVHGRTATGDWRLLHEDSGYVLREKQNLFVTRMTGAGKLLEAPAGEVRIQAAFFRSLHTELTPLQLIVLRTLNLTFLRWSWTAELFRRVVVRSLMTGRHPLAMGLTRCVRLEPDRVVVEDKIVDKRGSAILGELLHCRRVVGTHMASSRYFQENELLALPLGWADRLPWGQDGIAEQVFEISTTSTPNRETAAA
jgi:hypothetical protein